MYIPCELRDAINETNDYLMGSARRLSPEYNEAYLTKGEMGMWVLALRDGLVTREEFSVAARMFECVPNEWARARIAKGI